MMSAFVKVEHTRNLARLRQKKYYDLHKGEISIKKGKKTLLTPHSSLMLGFRMGEHKSVGSVGNILYSFQKMRERQLL
jgi:hypothetical protein